MNTKQAYFLRKIIPSKFYQLVTKVHLPQNQVDIRKLFIARHRLKDGGDAIDGGAHIGFFTRQLAEILGQNGHVYSFEPNPYVYSLLRKYTRSQSNITAFLKALSSQGEQVVDFYVVPHTIEQDSTLETSHQNKGQKKVQVSTTCLDDLKLERELKLIKLDIEGHELEALKGAEKLLMTHQPWVIFEYTNNTCVIEYLEKLGYFCIDLTTLKRMNCHSKGSLTDGLAIPLKEEQTAQSLIAGLSCL